MQSGLAATTRVPIVCPSWGLYVIRYSLMACHEHLYVDFLSKPGLLLILSVPAHATGGLSCKTADERPIVVSLGFGHVPSAGLFLARLLDDEREIQVTASQWWMHGPELRLALVSEGATKEELILIAHWNDAARSYDGSVWRSGRKHWVRCREA